jgi:hypothetical protein
MRGRRTGPDRQNRRENRDFTHLVKNPKARETPFSPLTMVLDLADFFAFRRGPIARGFAVEDLNG